jgi:DNA-binding GntR family transcriptional regulator
LAAVVAEQLRVLILDGTLEPGARLRLTAVAQRLGISIMPVRDALKILETEGLVVQEPRRGARVAPLTLEDAEELYAVRAGLESLAARVGVEKLTDGDVIDIRDLYGAMQHAADHGDLEAFVAADQAFHERIYISSQRPRLLQTIGDLRRRSRRYVPFIHRGLRDFETRMLLHEPILRAVEARNAPETARLTRDHLDIDPGLIARELDAQDR